MQTSTRNIKNLYEAMQYFRFEVHRIEGLTVIAHSQVFKYCWKVHTLDWIGDPEKVACFYVFFKRDHFHTFADKFPNLPTEYKTLGQTITLEALTKATQESDTTYVILVLEGGQIYYMRAKAWYEFAMNYKTVRHASNADTSDLEASVPIRLLKRLNPEA